MSSHRAKPAYVEDVDEDSGNVRNRRSASTKESLKPKVSHRDRKTKKPHSDAAYPGEGSSSQAQDGEVMREKEVRIERRKSSSSSTKSPRKSTRPPSSHENKPSLKSAIQSSSKREDPSHFGIPATTQYSAPVMAQYPAMAHRPRAVTAQTYPRPLSYHGAVPAISNSRPPLSSSAFWGQQPMITPSSYPPPPVTPSYMQYAAPSAGAYAAPTQGADYFTLKTVGRTLPQRFEPIGRPGSAFEPLARTVPTYEPISRTTSAAGMRAPTEYSGGYYEDSYASASDGTSLRRERRNSIRVPTSSMTKADTDSIAMPPPAPMRPGPSILRRTPTEYRTSSEYTTVIDPYENGATYRESRRQSREDSRPRRPSSNRHSVSYETTRGAESVRVEAANSGRRRQSWYEQNPAPAWEDKLHEATAYQDDVGTAPVPLTAEVLRRNSRRQGGSSRSTKSSASRDESDYKKSATTRTTRSMSGPDDENVKITVTGQARVMVGGTQIDCEGGEIQIQRQKSIRNGSERSGSEYGGRLEDRRSRVDRPILGRSRMSSQSGHSYTRSTPQYPMDNPF